MSFKREREAEEDDATWKHRNLERQLVLKETIYGPSHIAILPTLFELATTNSQNMMMMTMMMNFATQTSEIVEIEKSCEESSALLERALSIKDAHPSHSSYPSYPSLLCSLSFSLYYPCLLSGIRSGDHVPNVTKITQYLNRSLSYQEENGCCRVFHAQVAERLCLESHVQRRVEFQERLLKILEAASPDEIDVFAPEMEDRKNTIHKLRDILGIQIVRRDAS